MGQVLSIFLATSDDNLETFSLLWLDHDVNKTEENIRAREELQTVFNQLKTFNDPNRCEKYIQQASEGDRIVLIVSGQLGRQIVPRIHTLPQLLSVYVYCYDEKANEQWSSQYSKVRAVVNNLPELIGRIKFHQEQRQQGGIYETLPISIFDPKLIHGRLTTDLQGNLVHSQLLINCLLEMKSNLSDKNELITLSRQIYKNNKTELCTILEFEQKYAPQFAIAWYTRDSFLSRLLNKALRTQNIDILFLFQFFIVDIRQQLEKFRCRSSITVYRSQLMSCDELKKLEDAVGQFISINSFFSTTVDSNRARSYFKNNDGLEQVLFKIDADPQLTNDKPFANIKPHNSNKKEEEEVLFMLGSIFEVVKIKCENNGVWEVQIKLCSDNNQHLDVINNNNNNLFSFGHVLLTMGKIEEAEIYYRRLLENLTEDNPDRARCFEALGGVAMEKNAYDDSLKLYQNSLDINLKTLGDQHPDIASNYNSIGEVYRKKGNYSKALENYTRALKIFQETPTEESLAKKAVCLNNIGIVCQEQEKYQDALTYYTEAFGIRKKYFPNDQTSLGMSNNNIGNAHYLLGHYDEALVFYLEALKLYKKTLPSQHIKFASTYNNIGAIHDSQGNLKDAQQYYTEALKIYIMIYPSTNPNIIKIEENIRRISAETKK